MRYRIHPIIQLPYRFVCIKLAQSLSICVAIFWIATLRNLAVE